MWDFLFDFLFEILNSFWPGRSGDHGHASRVGDSKFEKEAKRWRAKWGIGLTLTGAAMYGVWLLWSR
ncbi:MAG: hypothetical protein V4726_04665 [Verrucomicrobiota bacterium]